MLGDLAPATQAARRAGIVARVRARLEAMDDDCVRVLEQATRGPQGAWELPGHGEPVDGLVLTTVVLDPVLDLGWVSAGAAQLLGFDLRFASALDVRVADVCARVDLSDRAAWRGAMQRCAVSGEVHDAHHRLRAAGPVSGRGTRAAWTIFGRAPVSPRTGARLLVAVLAVGEVAPGHG